MWASSDSCNNAAILRRAYTHTNVKTAKRLLQDLARRLDTAYPSAAASVREGLDETLTVLGLGLSERLQRSLATTNAIESLLSRTRHVKRNVKRWRGGMMVLRWVAAGVLEAAKGFRRVKGCQDMPALVAGPSGARRAAGTRGIVRDGCVVVNRAAAEFQQRTGHPLDALVSAQDTGTFTFTKGKSRNFLYENLSAEEKAAFDLLLDVVVNKVAFNDSLYCVDEPEIHLSTKLQGALLKELYRLVPGNSQLWLATHSIGMVRTAQEIRAKHPEHVVFLDMGFRPDGEPLNYDKPQTIEPADPDHDFWSRHYAVALDDMAELLAPDRLVLCEGSTQDDDPALDEACYNRIFAREFPRTRFVSVGPATTVEKRMRDLLPVLERIIGGTSIVRFRDRDALTPDEIRDKRTEGVRVMAGYRNIESMLLSDGVLSRLCDSRDMSDCFDAIRTARDNALIRAGVQHATDDLKPAAQAVHQAARSLLKLSRAGESKHAFMRDVLAPLVTADSPEYRKLRDDIFGQ